MDWTGDPGGVTIVALIALAILALIAAAWGTMLHNRRAHEGEFASSEPETMEEIHLHPTDVHTDEDPPSSM